MLRMKEVMKAGAKQDSKKKTASYSEIEKESLQKIMDLVAFMENVVIMGYFQRMDNYEFEHLD